MKYLKDAVIEFCLRLGCHPVSNTEGVGSLSPGGGAGEEQCHVMYKEVTSHLRSDPVM